MPESSKYPSFLATRRLRFTYIVALGTIATLTIVTQVLLHSFINHLSADAVVINIAGRQRMLSQRIAKTGLMLVAAARDGSVGEVKDQKTQLEEALTLWTSSHRGLITRDPAMGLAGQNSQEVAAHFDALEGHHQSVIDTAEKLLQLADGLISNPDRIEEAHSLAEFVTSEANRFLPNMNNIVFLYEAESSHRVKQLESIEWHLAIATLLVLGLEALLVFEPATRLIRRSFIRIEAANRTKSEFLANISHEIRTPMTAIFGYLDLLEDAVAAKDTEQSKDAIHTIRTNGNHLITIINDILDMSEIESGKLTVERIDVDPIGIIEETISSIRPEAVKKKLELDVRYPSSIPSKIRSDPTRLRQILENLVGNAVKFTDSGSVTLYVSANAPERTMRFDVIDTGIGMTPAQLASVVKFEAFSQVDGSHTRKFGGTGLGLCISKSLANMLGGRLEVESTLGCGSQFSVIIDTGDLTGVRMRELAAIDDDVDFEQVAESTADTTVSQPIQV